ncbi:response regulator [Paenirhodobacter sp.]|uniref:response regulator n=1 Tax=Paenirhodobacter sp. TaxID=1965326 RepID=UPI003B427703
MPLPSSAPVLVIEDIPSLRTTYQACLADAGYPVVTAKSAAEGLDLFHRSGTTVVLLSLFLPDRNGLDLMREMLALRPATAVIVLSVDLSIGRAVEAMRLGARDFLIKPVGEDRLLHAVAQSLLRPVQVPDARPTAPILVPDPEGTSPALPGVLSGLTLAEIEKIAIEQAIARHDGSVPRAASELGVAPSTIYRKMGMWRQA